jgi:hypothetical protein
LNRFFKLSRRPLIPFPSASLEPTANDKQQLRKTTGGKVGRRLLSPSPHSNSTRPRTTPSAGRQHDHRYLLDENDDASLLTAVTAFGNESVGTAAGGGFQAPNFLFPTIMATTLSGGVPSPLPVVRSSQQSQTHAAAAGSGFGDDDDW